MKEFHITNLQGYDNCPHCWYLENIVKVPRKEHPALLIGTAAHKAIEKWHKNGKVTDTMPGGPFLRAYIKHYGKDYREIPCEVEKVFKIPLRNPMTLVKTGHTFAGTIDRISNNWLFDHKTSKSNWSQEKADEDYQFSGYSLAHFLMTGDLPAGFTINTLIKNKTIVCRPIVTTRNMDDLVNVFNWICQTLQSIKDEEFDPNYGAFWHSYDICPGNK